jgi:pyruvate dehydrogenase E1 component alpha subunit
LGKSVREAHAVAAGWRLPIVYVIDREVHAAQSAMQVHPDQDFALSGEKVDGMDVRLARTAARRAIDRSREGGGPVVLEMRTIAYQSHAASMQAKARAPAARREETDPILKARLRLLTERVSTETELRAIEKDVREMVNAAAAAAKSASLAGSLAKTSASA